MTEFWRCSDLEPRTPRGCVPGEFSYGNGRQLDPKYCEDTYDIFEDKARKSVMRGWTPVVLEVDFQGAQTTLFFSYKIFQNCSRLPQFIKNLGSCQYVVCYSSGGIAVLSDKKY